MFIKNKEDFVCEHCGKEVAGNGFTNHCPACLWSKHVDVSPGDRQNTCGGLMEPIGIEQENQTTFIMHECTRCGFKKRNKVAADDDWNEVVKVSVGR